METYVYLFMISSIMCLFGLIVAGVNRRWWWVLGFAAGVIVGVVCNRIYL